MLGVAAALAADGQVEQHKMRLFKRLETTSVFVDEIFYANLVQHYRNHCKRDDVFVPIHTPGVELAGPRLSAEEVCPPGEA